jgi:hypothetical protein
MTLSPMPAPIAPPIAIPEPPTGVLFLVALAALIVLLHFRKHFRARNAPVKPTDLYRH